MNGKLRKILILGLLVMFGFVAGWQSERLSLVGEGAGHEHAASGKPTEQNLAGEEKVQYTCGMHPMIITDEPGLCPICNMELTPLKKSGALAGDGERQVKYWVAPMDPTYIRNEPGKSPMGMDLVPVYEDEATGGSVISIDPVTVQNMGVRTAAVERRDLSRTIRTVGLVEYDEPKRQTVTAKVAGWIERLYVDQLGQQVGKGAPLLEIYSPELVSAQEEYLLALENHERLAVSPFPEIADGAERLLEAAKRRLSLWDISLGQIETLEKTRKVQKTMTLYTPSPGIVTAKMMNVGGYVKPGMALYELSDISTVWVMADIYEFELPWVKAGLPARVALPFVGGKEVSAQVSYVYPFVEPRTRTVKARLELANPDFELKPDMYVNVVVETEPVRNVLSVPSEAILHSGEEKRVFVPLGGGRFEPRLVKVGAADDAGNSEIVQGLFDGERVVTSAQFMFDSESKLREAIRKMMEPPKDAADEDQSLEDLFE